MGMVTALSVRIVAIVSPSLILKGKKSTELGMGTTMSLGHCRRFNLKIALCRLETYRATVGANYSVILPIFSGSEPTRPPGKTPKIEFRTAQIIHSYAFMEEFAVYCHMCSPDIYSCTFIHIQLLVYMYIARPYPCIKVNIAVTPFNHG